jgi:hypothetical protein
MQDDDNWKYTLANSYLTIIAADGADADYILRVYQACPSQECSIKKFIALHHDRRWPESRCWVDG